MSEPLPRAPDPTTRSPRTRDVDQRAGARGDRRAGRAGDHERFAHYVRKEKILDSAISGKPVIALCGKVWVPGPGPEQVPGLPRSARRSTRVFVSRRTATRTRAARAPAAVASGASAATPAAAARDGGPSRPSSLPSTHASSSAASQPAAGVPRACALGDREQAARLAGRGRWSSTSPAQPRDFLAVATPGAGKTTFALTPRLLAAAPPRRAAGDRRRADRAPQEAVGGAAAPRGHQAGPRVQHAGPARPGVPRRRGDVRAGRRAARCCTATAREQRKTLVILDEIHHGGDAQVLGRGMPGGVRARHPPARADRHAVPVRHRPDPVRARTRRAATASGAPRPTTPTATATRSPTASCGP